MRYLIVSGMNGAIPKPVSVFTNPDPMADYGLQQSQKKPSVAKGKAWV